MNDGIYLKLIDEPVNVRVQPDTNLTLIEESINVRIDGDDVRVSEVGFIGPPGPPGYGQAAVVGTAECGANVSFLTVLVLIGGLVYPADPTNAAHLGKVVGVSRQSALLGGDVEYVLSGEIISATATLDGEYYVGLGGALSQTQVAVGASWTQAVGKGINSDDKFVVDIESAIAVN